MNYLEIPEGNGQKVYVDLDWVEEGLIQYLEEKCYDVVTDSAFVDVDTFCLYPCLDKHINTCKEEYQSKRDAKIKECFVGEVVQEPFSIAFPEDRFPDELPKLPFVLKNMNVNGGKEKFIIRTKEQIEILKKFYHEGKEYHRKRQEQEVQEEWAFLGDLFFDENGKSNKGICFWVIDYKKEFYKDMVIQEFIKTPTRYNTSMRILTSSSGDILCSSLKYMEPFGEQEERKYFGIYDRYLSDSSSPYYLGNESIISNTVAGGNSILLGKSGYSIEEREILAAHGIDFVTGEVPESLRRIATKIAENCRREIGAICGMDFIYDDVSKTWKYLEEHEFPMLSSYAEAYGFPYLDDGGEDYIRFREMHNKVEMDARLRALSLFMKKKQIGTKNDEQKVLKYK